MQKKAILVTILSLLIGDVCQAATMELGFIGGVIVEASTDECAVVVKAGRYDGFVSNSAFYANGKKYALCSEGAVKIDGNMFIDGGVRVNGEDKSELAGNIVVMQSMSGAK